MGLFSRKETYSSARKEGERVFRINFINSSGHSMYTDVAAKSASEAKQKFKNRPGKAGAKITSCS